MTNEIKGFVEIHGGVTSIHIIARPGDEYDWSVWLDSYGYDGVNSFDEFLDECDGKIYASLADYKKDVFTDLREWRKEKIR